MRFAGSRRGAGGPVSAEWLSAGSLTRMGLFFGALMMGVSGCAHRGAVPVPIDAGSLESRYRAERLAREARINGTAADLSLWIETATAGRLPGVHGTYGLGGDGTVRLRIASAFGTAVDASISPDSVLAYVPSRRTAVRAGADDPALGLAGLPTLCTRVISAAWPVPGHAWRSAWASDSLHSVRWMEGPDTIHVAVGESGLPRAVWVTRPGMSNLYVAYFAYGWHEGALWPTRFEVVEGAGRLRVTVRVRRLNRVENAAPGLWRADIPAEGSVLPARDLMRWIEEELLP